MSPRWTLTGVLFVVAAGCSRPVTPPAPLHVALSSAPITLDPHLHDEVTTYSVLGNLYEGLVGFDTEMAVQPVLAQRWESPDDLTWRFRLHPNVTFHDGRPLTAADVAFSLDRARRHPRSRSASYLTAIREVTVVDPLTLDLRTTRPFPLLLNKLAFIAIVPHGAPDEIREPIGTGPYRFVARHGDDRLDLAAFPRYWGEPAPISQVRLSFVVDNAERIRGLLGGELDLAVDLVMADLAPIEPTPGRRVAARPALGVSQLWVRVDRPPLADLRLRRALELALDRDALVRDSLGGRGTVATQLVSRSVFGFAPDLAAPAHDLAAAQRLVREAGFPNGVDLELDHQPTVREQVAVLRAQLAAAGIRVQTVEAPWEKLYARIVAGEARLFFAGWVCTSGDASDLFEGVLHTRDEVGGFGANNYLGYANLRLDRLVEESGATLDMRQRRRLLQEAMGLAMDDLPLVPLWNRHVLYGLRADVEWSPRADGRIYAREIRRRSDRR